MTETTDPIKLTRTKARRKVAELQGWTVDTNGGSFSERWVLRNPRGNITRKECNEARAWALAPDPFDPGNALALLFQLPEGCERSFDDNEIIISGDMIPLGDVLEEWQAWAVDTPETFATACVCAFITAHTGKRTEIEGE